MREPPLLQTRAGGLLVAGTFLILIGLSNLFAAWHAKVSSDAQRRLR
jgi:hypothetical protein